MNMGGHTEALSSPSLYPALLTPAGPAPPSLLRPVGQCPHGSAPACKHILYSAFIPAPALLPTAEKPQKRVVLVWFFFWFFETEFVCATALAVLDLLCSSEEGSDSGLLLEEAACSPRILRVAVLTWRRWFLL